MAFGTMDFFDLFGVTSQTLMKGLLLAILCAAFVFLQFIIILIVWMVLSRSHQVSHATNQTVEGTKAGYESLIRSIRSSVKSQHHKILRKEWLVVEKMNLNNYISEERKNLLHEIGQACKITLEGDILNQFINYRSFSTDNDRDILSEIQMLKPIETTTITLYRSILEFFFEHKHKEIDENDPCYEILLKIGMLLEEEIDKKGGNISEPISEEKKEEAINLIFKSIGQTSCDVTLDGALLEKIQEICDDDDDEEDANKNILTKIKKLVPRKSKRTTITLHGNILQDLLKSGKEKSYSDHDILSQIKNEVTKQIKEQKGENFVSMTENRDLASCDVTIEGDLFTKVKEYYDGRGDSGDDDGDDIENKIKRDLTSGRAPDSSYSSFKLDTDTLEEVLKEKTYSDILPQIYDLVTKGYYGTGVAVNTKKWIDEGFNEVLPDDKKNSTHKTDMMKEINFQAGIIGLVSFLKQINIGIELSQRTEIKEKCLQLKRIIEILRETSAPNFPQALEYRMIRELKNWKEGRGIPVSPILLSEKPWPGLRSQINAYLWSFFLDIVLHWIKLILPVLIFNILLASSDE